MVSNELFLHLKLPSKSKEEKVHGHGEGGPLPTNSGEPGVNSVTFKSLEHFKVLTKYYAGSFKGREGVATFVGS